MSHPLGTMEWLAGEVERYAVASRPPLHSLLIVQQGSVILERYWRGLSAQSYQRLNSVTKSVVSTLMGLALTDGYLTLGDSLAQWFPTHFAPVQHASRVTVRDLLTMTAGFDRRVARGGYIKASDPLPLLLARKKAAAPGHQFRYSNGDADLLAALLERAVGEPLVEYAQRRLFTPLGIWDQAPTFLWRRQHAAKHSLTPWGEWDERTGRLWKVDKQGRAKGAVGLHLTTRELARFGQLYLQGGSWEGAQLLPPAFVAASTTPQSRGGDPEQVGYGYLWWATQDEAGRQVFFAGGLGGQYVYNVPSLALVTIITSSSSSGGGPEHRRVLGALAAKALTTAR